MGKVNEMNTPMWQGVQAKAASLGIEVVHTKCDFGSEAACHKFVADYTPHLSGIIHSAGVLQDGLIMNQTWEKFDTVWDSKSRAALYLHNALEINENPHFDFFWMFSSTAVIGSMGQVNYSASNSYLDALCRHRKAIGRPACAMHWGAWGEVGMVTTLDAASKRRFAQSSMPPFSTADGLSGLEAGLRTGLPEFYVYAVNAKVMVGQSKSCGNVKECHWRNFMSEDIPAEASVSNDGFHAYTLFRTIRTDLSKNDDTSQRRIYSHFTKPLLDGGLDSSWW